MTDTSTGRVGLVRKTIGEFTTIDEALEMIVEALEEEMPDADAV